MAVRHTLRFVRALLQDGIANCTSDPQTLAMEQVDFLVVGSGIAGLRAAVELVNNGRVAVLTKDQITESNTEYAQGGVAVALSDDDAIELRSEERRVGKE